MRSLATELSSARCFFLPAPMQLLTHFHCGCYCSVIKSETGFPFEFDRFSSSLTRLPAIFFLYNLTERMHKEIRWNTKICRLVASRRVSSFRVPTQFISSIFKMQIPVSLKNGYTILCNRISYANSGLVIKFRNVSGIRWTSQKKAYTHTLSGDWNARAGRILPEPKKGVDLQIWLTTLNKCICSFWRCISKIIGRIFLLKWCGVRCCFWVLQMVLLTVNSIAEYGMAILRDSTIYK